jgi:hypothetical protein
MAVVKPSSLISTISGTIGKGKTGAITYSNYASGITVAKGYAVPTDFNTPKQQAIRTGFQAIAAAWSSLSPAQKAIWDSHVAVLQAAANSGVRLKGGVRDMARLDKPGRTGYQAFVKVNLFNNLAGNAIITEPNSQGTLVPTPHMTSLSFYNTGIMIRHDLFSDGYSTVLWIYDPTAHFHKQIAKVTDNDSSHGIIQFYQLVTKTGTLETLVSPVHLFGQLYAVDRSGNTSAPSATFPINFDFALSFIAQPQDTYAGYTMDPVLVNLSDIFTGGVPLTGLTIDADVPNTFDPTSALNATTNSIGNAIFYNLKVSPITPPGPRVLILTGPGITQNSDPWNVL